MTILRNETAQGVANARNRGIAQAKHPWIAFLDDDDRWSPDKLRVQLERLASEGADFAYTAGLAISASDGRVLYASPAFPPDYLRDHIRTRNLMFAGSSNVVARATLLRDLAGFDEALHHIADWDLWIRLTEAGRPAACPQPLVAYIVHENNMHRAAIDTAMREGRLLRAEHANSRLPGRFDAIVFRGWIADGQLESGRPGRRLRSRTRARRSATGALPTRGTRSARRCGRSTCAARRADALRRRTPDWLALRP